MKMLEDCLARCRHAWDSSRPLLAAIKALLDLCERKVAAFQTSGDAVNRDVMLAVSAEVERLCRLASELAHVTAGVASELRSSLAPELVRVQALSTSDDESQLVSTSAQMLELLETASRLGVALEGRVAILVKGLLDTAVQVELDAAAQTHFNELLGRLQRSRTSG